MSAGSAFAMRAPGPCSSSIFVRSFPNSDMYTSTRSTTPVAGLNELASTAHTRTRTCTRTCMHTHMHTHTHAHTHMHTRTCTHTCTHTQGVIGGSEQEAEQDAWQEGHQTNTQTHKHTRAQSASRIPRMSVALSLSQSMLHTARRRVASSRIGTPSPPNSDQMSCKGQQNNE